ncbi:MAG: metallopeptidase TldD-related protein, partial [Pontixanthobacter sp.]
MIDTQTACDRAAQLVDYAKRAGADAGDAMATASMSQTVSVRLGALEDADRSEDDGISLRVFVGNRSASVSGSDVSADAMADMAERAVAMARHAPEDPYARIATPDELAQGPFADLDLTDDAAPSAETLRSRAQAVEDAARAVSGVTNSEGGSAGTGRSVAAMATSTGFVAGYAATSHTMSASVIAGEGATMQRDHFARSARHAADLPPAEDIGRHAGERTVARLNPAGVGSATLPVLFDPRVSPTLIGHLLSAMNGMAAARRATFLLDRMDEPLFPDAIAIREEPHRPRGMRSRPFDGEGLATQPRALVEHSRATGWLTNLAAAAQLGIA